MNLEQLALLGIGVFGFMALAVFINAWRTVKRTGQQLRPQRMRRLLGGEELARSVARSVVGEVASNHPDAVRQSRRKGQLTPDLEQALDKARDYYTKRVESRYRVLFTMVVNEIVFDADDEPQ